LLSGQVSPTRRAWDGLSATQHFHGGFTDFAEALPLRTSRIALSRRLPKEAYGNA